MRFILTSHRWGYIDQQRNVIFIKRDLNGEKSGALIWDTARLDNRCTEYNENSDDLRLVAEHRSESWFHFKMGGEPDDKIERVSLLIFKVNQGELLLYYFWFQIAAGWVLTSLWVAGFTG